MFRSRKTKISAFEGRGRRFEGDSRFMKKVAYEEKMRKLNHEVEKMDINNSQVVVIDQCVSTLCQTHQKNSKKEVPEIDYTCVICRNQMPVLTMTYYVIK